MMRTALPSLPLPRREGDEQSFHLLMLVGVICLVFHALFIPLFAAAGARPLALFNIGSVAAWSAGLWLGRRGHVLVALILIQTEGICHAIVAVHYIGVDTGFQQYLIPVAVCAFIVKPRRLLSGAVAVISTGAYVALHYARPVLPSSVIDLLRWMFIPNTVASLLIAIITIAYYMRMLDDAEAALQKAHEDSELLLTNVLPESIAARLKHNEIIADGFKEASILFADIEGFTPYSQRVTPLETVQMLDDVFSRFDEILDCHGLEKIKTIGDAYMAVAGIPKQRPDHAAALARFALEIRAAFAAYTAERGIPLRLRIGMHSAGPVVAGVIGRRRFLYDLWGDAVNTASRMESHGEPNEIQVTEEMCTILRNEFVLQERGVINVKGKGKMRTFLLKGIAESSASALTA